MNVGNQASLRNHTCPQVDAEVLAKMEGLLLLEVELCLMVPKLLWVPDQLATVSIMGLPSAERTRLSPSLSRPVPAAPGT